MRECPKCGYVDPPYWRNRLFDYEVDICRWEDLAQIDRELSLNLYLSQKGTTILKEPYCYRLTKTLWVYRIHYPLFKVRGWIQHYDGSCSRASALRKQNLRAYGLKGVETERKLREKGLL